MVIDISLFSSWKPLQLESDDVYFPALTAHKEKLDICFRFSNKWCTLSNSSSQKFHSLCLKIASKPNIFSPCGFLCTYLSVEAPEEGQSGMWSCCGTKRRLLCRLSGMVLLMVFELHGHIIKSFARVFHSVSFAATLSPIIPLLPFVKEKPKPGLCGFPDPRNSCLTACLRSQRACLTGWDWREIQSACVVSL
jgi:hypothetical protein